MKKLSLILLLLLLLTALPCGNAWAAETVASGYCGENVTWTLDSNGYLTIGGTGAMDDYTFHDLGSWGFLPPETPWYSHNDDIYSIIINSGVTGIGSCAFYECGSLREVTLPTSVTDVGEYAFYDCNKLSRVNYAGTQQQWNYIIIRSNNYYLEKAAKNYAAAVLYSGTCGAEGADLSWMLDSNGLLTIYGTGAMEDFVYDTMQNCSCPWSNYAGSIYSVDIRSGVTSIGDRALQECTNLTSVSIPEGVTSIGLYAFDNCVSLTSISIPSSLTSISGGAFLSCNSLNAVYITDVAAWCSISFNDIDNPLSYAHNLYLNGALVTDLVIPDGVTHINDSAFFYCTSLTSVTIPPSVTSSGEYAFYRCNNLNAVYISDMAAWYGISFNGDSSNPLACGHNLYLNGNLVREAVFPDGMTSIDRTFEGASCLTSVTISDSVTNIGNYAFYGCSGLTSVTIPDSVTSIGGYAFAACSGLTSLTIGNNVANIWEYAFNNCSSLTSVTIPNSVTGISNYAFSRCYRLTSVTIPDSVAYLGKGVFYECNSLTDVIIPDSITSIGDYTFYRCYWLTSLTIPDGVTSIGYQAFYCCSRLTSVNIPDTVTSIGDSAFLGCSSLTTVNYGGLASQWSSISIGGNNDPLLAAELICAAPPLDITGQPQDYTGAAGSTIKFTVAAEGEGLTYQWWYRKGSSGDFTKSTLASGKKATFTMTMADKYDGWQYYCVVKDSAGNTAQSNTVTIHKAPNLTITTQPVDFTGAAGSTIKFTVKASGQGLSYQWWYRKGSSGSFTKSTLAAGKKATFTMTMADKYD
ncbi:MAG: leucine-rich repeat protein, partial [Firmicutes bacterium]|nr:leucine-rich repeat protein [Bacillota bacterium]